MEKILLKILIHVYQSAEVYTVVLTWLVVPMVFWVFYRFFRNNYGMFVPNQHFVPSGENLTHGSDR